MLELEYLGTQGKSEEFEEFLRNAAGYLNLPSVIDKDLLLLLIGYFVFTQPL